MVSSFVSVSQAMNVLSMARSIGATSTRRASVCALVNPGGGFLPLLS